MRDAKREVRDTRSLTGLLFQLSRNALASVGLTEPQRVSVG
jgi:hypothetical protein